MSDILSQSQPVPVLQLTPAQMVPEAAGPAAPDAPAPPPAPSDEPVADTPAQSSQPRGYPTTEELLGLASAVSRAKATLEAAMQHRAEMDATVRRLQAQQDEFLARLGERTQAFREMLSHINAAHGV